MKVDDGAVGNQVLTCPLRDHSDETVLQRRRTAEVLLQHTTAGAPI